MENKEKKKMIKATKYGTSISISAGAFELLREFKAQSPAYERTSFSCMVQWLVAERLNEIKGNKEGVDYIDLFGLRR